MARLSQFEFQNFCRVNFKIEISKITDKFIHFTAEEMEGKSNFVDSTPLEEVKRVPQFLPIDPTFKFANQISVPPRSIYYIPWDLELQYSYQCYSDKIRESVLKDMYITTIKMVRNFTAMGLKDSKDLVDYHKNSWKQFYIENNLDISK